MKELRQKHFADRPPEPVYDDRPRTVSRHEQEQLQMVKRATNFVPAEITAVAKRGPAQVLPVQETAHTLDIPLQSTQHIEMRTSAVDRAKGFLIVNVPLFCAFAAGVWMLSGAFALAPWFSITALLIFWLSFVAAWLASYAYTLHVSAEGVSMFEARSKWRVIMREQDRRWEHYDKLTGGDE